MLTVGSLCSGACDGMALGLEWAGIGPVLWQVEIDADRRTNLARHWPDADRSVHDVRFAGAGTLRRVDIITATFPCTDLSSAGARAGLDGARSGLWFECLRCITELRPAWVVVENVASGARNWVPHVREGLERLGYACIPLPIAASDCGAPHRRSRVFIVAHADRGGEFAFAEHEQVARALTLVPELLCDCGHSAEHHGADPDIVRFKIRSECEECSCLSFQPRPQDVADAYSKGWSIRPPSGARTRSVGERDPARTHQGWPAELEVSAPDDGVSGRVVSGLGDSVTPQQAEVVGWVIRELLDAERSRYLAEKRAVEGGRG